MNPKKCSLIILFFLLFINFSTPSIASSNFPSNITTLRIGGDNNYPPYEYVDTNGIYKGFNVDIIRAIAIELGLEIELIPTTWENAIELLKIGQIDAIQGMTVTLERDELFDFTQEIVENSQAIFVLSNTSYITELNDLEGKIVSIQAEDVTNEILAKVPGAIIIVKVNQLEAIQALLSGEVDAFVGNRLTGIYYTQRFGLTESIKIVGEPISTTMYSTAVRAGDRELLNLLDSGIAELKKNGTYDKIYKKWFGEIILDVNKKWKDLLTISLTALLVSILIISLIYYWNKNLKSQVASRTMEIDQSNRFKGKVIDSIINGIVAFDEYFNVIQSNPLASALLEKDIVEGQSYQDLMGDIIPSEAITYAKSGNTWRENLEWSFDSLSIKYVDCSLIPIIGPEKIEGFILLINDKTKEIELYNLAKHNDKMKALGELSAGVAHELRNPLTSIKAFIDLIPSKINDENFKKELVRIVPKEVNRLDDLVSSLLNYSKPKNPQPTIIQLDTLFTEVLTLLRQKLNEKSIQVLVTSKNTYVYADESQIKQILINIILNSIDAVDIKGKIEIEGNNLESKTSIMIRDNGPGIPKVLLSKLFEPFYTSKKTGYGIGLSITDRLIRDNKGDIKIDSDEGHGTTVTINLPIEPPIS